MTDWIDRTWLDDLKDVHDENEILREQAAQLERQLQRRTTAAGKAVESVMRKNDELEAEMKKSEARKDFEAGRITLKEMVLADFAGGREPEPVEGRKQREPEGLPGLLNVYMNNLDQPVETDTKRQAIHDNQWKTATFNHLGALTAQLDAQKKERARRAEAERLERERLERERAKVDAGRHIYGVGS